MLHLHLALSVIVPARNAETTLGLVLSVWEPRGRRGYELIVVDDASTDGTADVAARYADRVLKLAEHRGPAAARNAGARASRGDILLFVDADVRATSRSADLVVRAFRENPGLDAVFGSYDDRPAEQNFLSQFKNLLHHFVHQNADEEARTFWTGCGAIRRKEFLEVGGFSETYALPSIEDVEFGYRLKGSGKTIRLLKALQVTHLKRWTFAGLLRSDIAGRAIPWTKLACARGLPRDLNFRLSDRLSAFLAWLLPLSLAASVLRPSWVIPAAGAAILLLLINRALYRFFLKKRGLWFAAGAVFWHWLYLLYASAVFILWAPACLVKRIFGRRPAWG
jgi:glycosyltransferase involved in cell wall biosynthesis